MHLRQASFAGGEISDTLQGRADVGKYQTALSRCRNMIPLRHGPVTSRPGTKSVAQYSATARLAPFVAANSVAYVLVFRHLAVDVYSNYGGGNTLLGTVTTPYTGGEISALTWSQRQNVLTICHANHAPYELKRIKDSGPFTWTLTEVSFAATAYKFWDATTTGVPKLEMSSGVVRTWSATDFYDTSDPYFVFVKYGAVVYYSVIDNYNKQPDTHCSGVVGVDKFWSITTYGTNRWQWAVTTLYQDANSRVFESAAFQVTKCRIFGRGVWDPAATYAVGDRVSVNEWSGAYYQSLQNANTDKNPYLEPAWWSGPMGELESGRRHIYGERAIPDEIILNADVPTVISWQSQTQTPIASEPRVIGWRVYRGEYGATNLGWIGDTTVERFVDVGNAPDYTRQPPQGRNPFVVYDGTGAVVATENPTCVSYFEQRRVFGGPYSATTGGRPGWLFGSKTGLYSNFDSSLFNQTADQEYEFELASQRFEEIRAMLPVTKLLVFTSESEWSVAGAAGGALAFNNVDAKAQGCHGSAKKPAPILVGNEALYVQERGPHVQSIAFDLQTQSWDGEELNLFADHLLGGKTIVAWCWAHQPYHAVFIVLSDGTMLSMTYHPEQKVNAWAMHTTAGGSFLDICTIPEDGHDTIYLLVSRGSKICLERMALIGASPTWTLGVYLDGLRDCLVGTSPTFPEFQNQTVTVIQDDVVTTHAVNGAGIVQGLTMPLASGVLVGIGFVQRISQLAPVLQNQETRTLFGSLVRYTAEVIGIGNIQVGQDADHLQTVSTGVPTSSFYASQRLVESRVPNKFVKWPSEIGVVQQSGPYPLTVLALTRDIEFKEA